MPLYYSLETYNPDALRSILSRKGITPNDVARRTRGEVSVSTIKNMRRGKRPTVRTGTVETLAKVLYVDEDELRGDGWPEVFKIVLREAKSLVDSYWWAITAVAERLTEVGYLSGEEVQEIVFGSDPSEDGSPRWECETWWERRW
jgi:transcriptional regulator with XRE-family HTH domain